MVRQRHEKEAEDPDRQVAEGPRPILSPEPAALAFGDVRLGEQNALDLLLRNTGEQTLTVTSITFEDGTSDEISAAPLGSVRYLEFITALVAFKFPHFYSSL